MAQYQPSFKPCAAGALAFLGYNMEKVKQFGFINTRLRGLQPLYPFPLVSI